MGSYSGVASSLGNLGFGGFHKKKPQPAAQTPTSAPPNSAVLMESTVEMTNFSSVSVDPTLFNVPAGYAKVPSEYQKSHQ
jgi:hypothetical protein